MKKIVISLSIASAIIGFSFDASAQASATATATSTIVTPISITKTVDMNFGNVAVSASTGGTVILATDGTRTTGGAGGVTLPATAGTVTAATFTVDGEGAYTYDITVPSTDVTLSDGAAHTMIVNAFTSNPGATAGALTAGTQELLVGATLNVAAAQAAGTYVSGTPFTVMVNYN